MTAYYLPYREKRKLHDRAYRAQQRDHSEVCGIMAIDSKKRIELLFLKNNSKNPYHYEINTKEIQTIKKKISANNKRILGSFHSHPIGEANPSILDLKNAFFNSIEMIYDVCAREIKLWKKVKYVSRSVTKELPLILVKKRGVSDRPYGDKP